MITASHCHLMPLTRHARRSFSMGLRATALALVSLCLVACGTASTAGEGWAYLGNIATLRSPVPVLDTRLSQEQRMKAAQDSLASWKTRVSEALAVAKSECAKESGEPATPNALFGYGKAFETCMRSRGWQRGSNPL